MSDKTDLIYDLVKSNREELTDFRGETQKAHSETHSRLTLIEVGLAEHMRRTDILEDLHRDNENRIQILEEPKKVFSILKKWFIGLGAIAGAMAGIAKLLGLF